MLARPPWETVWTLLDGHFGAGLVPDYQLNPDLATAYDQAGCLPGWMWPLPPVALAAFYAYILLIRGVRQDARGKVAVVLLSLVALQLALNGFSPQAILWLVPLTLMLRPDGRGFALVLALTLLEQFRWGVHIALGQPDWWMVPTVSLRTLAQIAIGVWAFRIVRPAVPQARARPLRRTPCP